MYSDPSMNKTTSVFAMASVSIALACAVAAYVVERTHEPAVAWAIKNNQVKTLAPARYKPKQRSTAYGARTPARSSVLLD
jgi:hypothetical protein